jgi:hypothetical protein
MKSLLVTSHGEPDLVREMEQGDSSGLSTLPRRCTSAKGPDLALSKLSQGGGSGGGGGVCRMSGGRWLNVGSCVRKSATRTGWNHKSQIVSVVG